MLYTRYHSGYAIIRYYITEQEKTITWAYDGLIYWRI